MLTYSQQRIMIYLKKNKIISSFSGQNIYRSYRFYKNMRILEKARLIRCEKNPKGYNEYRLTFDGHITCNNLLNIIEIEDSYGKM